MAGKALTRALVDNIDQPEAPDPGFRRQIIRHHLALNWINPDHLEIPSSRKRGFVCAAWPKEAIRWRWLAFLFEFYQQISSQLVPKRNLPRKSASYGTDRFALVDQIFSLAINLKFPSPSQSSSPKPLKNRPNPKCTHFAPILPPCRNLQPPG